MHTRGDRDEAPSRVEGYDDDERLLPGFTHVVCAPMSDTCQLQLMNWLSDEGVRRLGSVTDQTAAAWLYALPLRPIAIWEIGILLHHLCGTCWDCALLLCKTGQSFAGTGRSSVLVRI
jgi:hypothetical protein